MRNILLAGFLAVANPFAGLVAEEGKSTVVAVTNFSNQTGKTSLDFLSGSLAEATSSELTSAPGIQLTERLQMDKVLREVEISQSGLLENDDILDSARMKNAEFLLVGSYTGSSARMTVNFRLVSVKTARVATSESITGSVEEIFEKMGIVRSMAAGLTGGKMVRLDVLSTPGGAEVFLDSRLAGTTPLTGFRLPPGKHDILLHKDGYEDYTETLNLVDGKIQRQYNLYPELIQKYYLQAGAGYWFSPLDMESDHVLFSAAAGTRWQNFDIFISYEMDWHITEEYSYQIPYKTKIEVREYRQYAGFVGVGWHFLRGQYLSPYLGLGAGLVYLQETEPDSILHNYKEMDYRIFAVKPFAGFLLFSRSRLQIFSELGFTFGVNPVKMERIQKIDFLGNVKKEDNPTHYSHFSVGAGVRYAF